MKTETFINRAKELGFNINIRCEDIQVHHHRYGLIATVQINKRYVFDIKKYFDLTSLKEQEKLFSCLVDYARTPLEEREEEKKYIYRFPFHITARNVETKHICRNHTFRESGESNDLIIDLSPMDTVVTNEKFLFTDKEVEKFTGRDRALFNICKKIEVTP